MNTIDTNSQDVPKSVFIGEGGFYICYFMGLLHYVFQCFGTESFRQTVFEGVSAGGQAAGYAVATVHGVGDMHTWLRSGPIGAMRRERRFGTHTLACYRAGVRYYEELQAHQKQGMVQFIRDYYRSFATTVFGKPFVMDKIIDKKTFGQAVASTGNVPILGSVRPWRFQEKPLWDGAIAFRLHPHKCIPAGGVCIFRNAPAAHLLPPGVQVIDCSAWRSFPDAAQLKILFASFEHAEKEMEALFAAGVHDARIHHCELAKAFGFSPDATRMSSRL